MYKVQNKSKIQGKKIKYGKYINGNECIIYVFYFH